MRKIISFVHISLDGFVSGSNGEMNWIKVDAELFDYVGKRIALTDTALYGRKTYDMMEGYWPTAGDAPNASDHDKNHSRWYMAAHKVVLSRTMAGADLPNTTIISNNLAQDISNLKSRAGRSDEILLFGSPTATHSLMVEGLIDGYWLFVNPVILGKGVPLFADIQQQTKLKLMEPSQVFASGVRELNYLVNRG